MFENLVIADTLKRKQHRAGRRGFHFSRDNHGQEVDLAIADGPPMDLVEIKSGQTAYPDLWKHIPLVRGTVNHPGTDHVIYGGENEYETLHRPVRPERPNRCVPADP